MSKSGKKNTGKQGNPKIYVSALYGGDVMKNSTVRLVVSDKHPQLTFDELSKVYGSEVKVNYYTTFNNINHVNESFDNRELNEKLVNGTSGQPVYKISIKDLKEHMKTACKDDDDKVSQCKTINVYGTKKKSADDDDDDDNDEDDKKKSSKSNKKDASKSSKKETTKSSKKGKKGDDDDDDDDDEDEKKSSKKKNSKETTKKGKDTKKESTKKKETTKKQNKKDDTDDSDEDVKNTAKIDISDDSDANSDSNAESDEN